MQDFKQKMRTLKKPAVFLAIFLCLILILSAFFVNMAKKHPEFVQSRNRPWLNIQNEKKNSIDVLVLGDSESYTTFSPLEIWKQNGIASFVCGQTGQEVEETYYMLRRTLRTQEPKVVVFETNNMFQPQNAAEGFSKTIAQTVNYYFPVFLLHSMWQNWLMGPEKQQVYYKGFVVRDIVEPYDGGSYMEKTERREYMSRAVRSYMDKMLAMCREKGISVILYSAPSPNNYNYAKHNTLTDYAEQNGAEYLDFNLMTEELGIDWEKDSLDNGDHLNVLGAEKLSRYFGSYLEEHYDLEDHRKDPEYSSWNEDVQKYQNAEKNAIRKIEVILEYLRKKKQK